MWALIRLDKIGDLVCTLPADSLLPSHEKKIWIIYDDLKPLLENRINSNQIIFRTIQRNQSWRLQYKQLRQILHENKIDHLILYYGPWWVGLAAIKEKVKFRFSRYFKPWTYLFFNHGLRQSRSQSEKHELIYNIQLTNNALTKAQVKPENVNTSNLKLQLQVQSPRRLFEKYNLQHKKYLVIHPSMAGSALNWTSQHWSKLIQLCLEKYKVVITGSSADESFLNQLAVDKNHSNLTWSVNQFSFYDLLGILQSAKTVIAPSTGVLHLASSLSTKCIGIYPPVLSQHPRRWAANGAEIFLPNVNCPAQKKCLLEKCPNHPCMKLINPEEIFLKTQNFMDQT